MCTNLNLLHAEVKHQVSGSDWPTLRQLVGHYYHDTLPSGLLSVCLRGDETGAPTTVHPAAAVSWRVSILVACDLGKGWDWASPGQPCATES